MHLLAFAILAIAGDGQAVYGQMWRWFNYDIDGRNRVVFSIMHDSGRRAWIGTNSGLYLFNGFGSYPATYGDSQFSAQVYAMAEVDGKIYVGSNNGLFILEPASLKVEEVSVVTPREIRALAVEGSSLWIGSLNGLFRYDVVSGTIDGPVEGLSHNAVYSLLSIDGVLYAGTYDGLCRRRGDSFEQIPLLSVPGSSGNCFVNAMCRKSDGLIYLGLESGLLVFDPATGATRSIPACEGNSIKALAPLGSNLAAGSDNGLLVIQPDGEVRIFRHDSRNLNSLVSNVVWSLWSDNADVLWAGTEQGLAIADINSPVRIVPLVDITGLADGLQVYNFFRDSRRRLWLGGSNGLVCIDGDNTRWYQSGRADHSLSHPRVRDVTEISDGSILVATDGGINLLRPGASRFENHRITDDSHRHNANWAYGVLEDTSDGTLWTAGFLGGVFVKNLAAFNAEGTFHVADTVFSDAGSLPNTLIGQLIADSRGNKWVLHYRNPTLSRIDGRTREVRAVSLAPATDSEPVIICAGPDSTIWCAVYQGVARLDLDGNVDQRVVRFPYSDRGSVSAMGMVGPLLWVATEDAVYSIDPQSLEARFLPLPPMSISSIYYDESKGTVLLGSIDNIITVDLARFNASIAGNGLEIARIAANGSPLTFDGSMKIALPNDNRDIAVSLGTADFSPARHSRFCYSLDGSMWRLIDPGENTVNFTSLPPGKHTLNIGIAGSDSPQRSIVFDVARPWYAGWSAFTAYGILLASLVTLIIWRLHRNQKQRLEEAERRSVLASVERRMTFLANISHELKTPLSMIIGPLSRLQTDTLSDRNRKDIDTAYRNAVRLNTLIHQTVELNRADESADAILIYSRIDAVSFCRDIIEAYRVSAPEHNFVFDTRQERLDVRIDVVKLESLLNNLIMNAIKYTPDGSSIVLSVRGCGQEFKIVVADEGPGIPEEEQSLVFERLYRSSRTSSKADGTGIGLYLVRRYAGMMGGNVTLESVPGHGASFTLTLPVNGDNETVSADGTLHAAPGKPAALIVDDNRSIAAFIASVLSEDFACTIADNGRSGLTMAATVRPAVIIADEMMPVMTGLDMTRRLRRNPATANIPVLILTAKDSPATYAASLEAGADSFMAKPFETRALLAKVRQLVATLRTREAPAEVEEEASDEAAAVGADQKRLAAITAVIEANISNPDLSVAYVCDKTAISSKTLYRLVKKYTGVSPLDYIRQTRLRQAAALFDQGSFSVSEVMYMVGFSSSSYFSKCFAQQFGCTPGKYAAEART